MVAAIQRSLLATLRGTIQEFNILRNSFSAEYGQGQSVVIAVTKSGSNDFYGFPRWSDRYQHAVVELLPGGGTRPYPDEKWNKWDGKAATAGSAFICVQSIVSDDNNSLWILDLAAPPLGPTVPGGPKLVQIELKSN